LHSSEHTHSRSMTKR